MIHVADCLPGAGKSTASRNKMRREIGRKRFLYATPYNAECERMVAECGDWLKMPNLSSRQKTRDVKALMRRGCSVATTHEMINRFDDELIKLARDGKYTLFLDEAFDTFSKLDLSADDISLLTTSGIMSVDENGVCGWTAESYHGRFDDVRDACADQRIVLANGGAMIWQFPIEVFNAFEDVYVLTHMFETSQLCSYFKIMGLSYEYIGVRPAEDGYEFCELDEASDPRSIPSDLVHIYDGAKYNECGKAWNAFGITWGHRQLDANPELAKEVATGASNIMRNIWKVKAKTTFWTCAKCFAKALQPAGMQKTHIAWNTRATNDYREYDHMIFLHNIFMDVDTKRYLASAGAPIDENQYALAYLIQWMWRSALRDGKEVWIYIPSSRMRALLKQWLGQPLDGWERQAMIECASRGLDNGECADDKE